MWQIKRLRASGLLLLVAIIWGSGFVAQRSAMQFVGPLTFVTVRLLLGAVVLMPLLCLRQDHRSSKAISGRARWVGLISLSGVLFMATWLQQAGLVTTQATVGGFITSLYILFVPLLGLLIGYSVTCLTWFAIALAVFGFYFLSFGRTGSITVGDLLVLVGSVMWAFQVLLVGWLSPRMDARILTVGQLGGAGILAAVLTPWFEPIQLAQLWAANFELFYSGVLATGLAFLLQIVAQRDEPPAHAAMIVSLEAVFGALFGWWLLSESLACSQWLGCLIILAAILLGTLPPHRSDFFPQNKTDTVG